MASRAAAAKSATGPARDEILARDPAALPGATSNHCFFCWYVLTRGLANGVKGGGGQIGNWTGARRNPGPRSRGTARRHFKPLFLLLVRSDPRAGQWRQGRRRPNRQLDRRATKPLPAIPRHCPAPLQTIVSSAGTFCPAGWPMASRAAAAKSATGPARDQT